MQTPSSTPLLSVVIPTYHRNDLLAKCLDCLHPRVQALDSSLYEVIVTDDGRDSTVEQLISEHYPWVRWVKGPQRGPAANRNNGAKLALGDWLVFTDDDCLPTQHWLQAYFEGIATNEETQVFEGRTIADRPQMRYDEEAPINETGGNLWSCNFCISHSLFQQVGGFDEEFKYASMEDVDLLTRIHMNNIEPIFIKHATVIHPFRLVKKGKFNETLWSFQYFLAKYNQVNRKYRITRLKHFVKSLGVNAARLATFNFRGWKTYIWEHIFLLKLIFVHY